MHEAKQRIEALTKELAKRDLTKVEGLLQKHSINYQLILDDANRILNTPEDQAKATQPFEDKFT